MRGCGVLSANSHVYNGSTRYIATFNPDFHQTSGMVYRLASVAFIAKFLTMSAPDESRVRLPVPEHVFFFF